MKKIALVIAGLLVHFSGFGQKGLFVGMYNNDSNFDTSVRVFMSYDSVKLVSTTRMRNGDMWLQLKCGAWAIKSRNPDGGIYTITFLFNNGTSEDVIFKASYLINNGTSEDVTFKPSYLINNGTSEDVIFKPGYLNKPPEPSTPPAFYSLYIGYMDFEKIFGKGSIMERDIFDFKTIYGK